MAAPRGAPPHIVTPRGDPLQGPRGRHMRGDMRGMRGDIFGDMRGDLRGYQGGGAPYQGGDMQYQGGGKGGDRHGDMLYQGGKGGKGGDIRGDMHYQGSGAPYLAGDMHYQGGGKGGDMRGDMRYQGDGKGGGDRRGDMHYQGGDMRGGMRGDMHGDMRGSMPGDMRMMEANFGPGAQYPQAGMQHQQKYMAPVERLAVERQMRQMPMQNARVTTQDAASLTALEISKLLSSRETCRGMRDWATADAIKQQLRGAGVHVDDVEKRWSFGGASGPIFDEEAVASGQAEHPPVSDDEINGMLAKREDARRRRDWEVADGIKVFLRQNGIQVWDADKMWKSNDGSRSGTFG